MWVILQGRRVAIFGDGAAAGQLYVSDKIDLCDS